MSGEILESKTRTRHFLYITEIDHAQFHGECRCINKYGFIWKWEFFRYNEDITEEVKEFIKPKTGNTPLFKVNIEESVIII